MERNGVKPCTIFSLCSFLSFINIFYLQVDEYSASAPDGSEYGRSKDRFQKIAKIMHELNDYVRNHNNLRPLLLPLRDGLTIVQYVKS
jgi:hypothetical protein